MRLWHYQTLVVNSIVLLGFLGYGGYTAWEQSARERTEIASYTRNLAQSIAAGSADDILTASFDRIESRLLRQVNVASVRELLIADADGKVLVKAQRPPGGTASAVYDEPALSSATTVVETFTDNSYTFLAPIERGELLGYVRITAGLERLHEMRRHIWQDTLEASALIILLLSVIQILLLRRIGRTLEDTSDFAANLIHQLGSEIDPHSRIRELAQLKQSLNQVSRALARQHHELTGNEARKGAMLEASLDCIIIIDEASRIVEFNKAAEQTFGHERESVLGREMTELIVPPTHREAHTAGMRHHLATGEGPILRKRLELAAVRRSGEEFPVELTVVPFTAVGQRYFLGALRDITELKLLEEERQQTNQLLQRTVSELDARQKALDEHAIVSVTDLQGTILYANGKFNEISGYSNAELLGQNHRLLKSGMHDAAFYEDLWSTISEGSTWQGEIANRRKDGSVYWVTSTIVPILDSQGLPLQYIAIRTDITEQKRSAIRLAQARSRELAVGHQIQQTLLLGQIPKQVSGVSISAYNEASAGIDGDFYEFIPQDDRSFNIIIGDVMGKGIPAALIGAGVKQEMHKVIAARSLTGGLADYGFEPAAVVNDLHHRTFPSLSKLDSFVTMAALRFDPTERRVTYVDAGHTKTILAGRAGTRMLAGENMPLGVLAEESYVQHHVDWRPGDLLLMYSDGLTEARGIGGELFGEERLTRIVEQLRLEKVPAAIVAQAVRKQVRDFRGEQTPSDDSTCIAVHFDHADAGTSPPTQVELHWELAELAALRAEIVQLARNARLADEEADALVLAVSETATNIIRHVPQPPFDAVIHCRATCMARGLDVSFHYLGQPFAPPDGDPDFSGASEGGFGLYIVRNSVDEVSYDTLGFGVQRIQLSKHRRRDGEAARETP